MTLLQIDMVEDEHGNAALQYKTRIPVRITDEIRSAVKAWFDLAMEAAMKCEKTSVEVKG